MASKELNYRLTATDASASKNITGVSKNAEGSAKKIGSAFSNLGSKIGGEFGEVLNVVGEGFDKLGESGHSAGAKIAAVGAGLAGAGALLVGLGDKEKAASQQLDQAITNTGQSAGDFRDQIEHTVKSMEKYGNSAVSTKEALTTLTNATHDPAKALDLMGVAADYAAAKHISLNDAAAAVGKGFNGNAKIFKQFGIVVGTNADGTKDYAGAMQKLAQVVHGQASAAADTFTGKLKALRTEISDHISELGQKYGPAITAIGATMTVVGPIAGKLGDGLKALASKFGDFAKVSVAADEEALASTSELAGGVEESAATQNAAFTQVSGGAVAASGTAVAADTAAEDSTTALAAAVRASASAQVGAMGEVAAAAEATAGTVVVADAEMAAASEASASKFGKLRSSGATASIGLLAFAAAAYVVGKKISDATEKNNALAQTMNHSSEAAANYRQALLATNGAIDDNVKATVAASLQQSGLADKASAAGISIADLTTAVTGNADGFSAMVERWKASGKPAGDTIVALGAQYLAFHKAAQGAQESAEKNGKNTKANKDSVPATDAAAAAEKKRADALQKVIDKLNALGKTQITELQSQDAWRSSLDSLTSSVKDNGKSLSVSTEKGRANREALISSAQAALAYADSQQKLGIPIATVTKNLEANVRQLEATAHNAGLSDKQVAALVKHMGLTPSQINTYFNVGTATANARLDALIKKFRSMDGKTVTTYTQVIDIGKGSTFGTKGGNHPGGGTYKLTAGGSDFFPGGDTEIAEREPEMIALPRGSKVTPLSRMGSGHGAVNVNFHITINGGGGGTAQQGKEFVTAVERWVAQGGKMKIAKAIY